MVSRSQKISMTNSTGYCKNTKGSGGNQLSSVRQAVQTRNQPEKNTRLTSVLPDNHQQWEITMERSYSSRKIELKMCIADTLYEAGLTKEASDILTLEDLSIYLDENIPRWKNENIQDGRAQGLVLGTAIGRAQGIRQILHILLEDRFGTLPRIVASYIASSDAEALTSFAVFANRAPSVQAVTDHIYMVRALS